MRGDDFMFFARAGYAGTQAVAPVIWSGDPAASFDDEKGLPAQVRAGINAGLSGMPFWGSDISGYACLNDPPPDKEVYLRWAEFGALSSDMHDENACARQARRRARQVDALERRRDDAGLRRVRAPAHAALPVHVRGRAGGDARPACR